MINRLLRKGPSLQQLLDASPHVSIGSLQGRQGILVDPRADRREILDLLDVMWYKRMEFTFHDTTTPWDPDSGGYYAYSRYHSPGPPIWSMTLGNHGWSGGIYHIRREVVACQIGNLVKNHRMKGIQTAGVSFFSHYEMHKESRNREKNESLAREHAH